MTEEKQFRLLELAVGITRSLIESNTLATTQMADPNSRKRDATGPAMAVDYYFNHLKSLIETNS